MTEPSKAEIARALERNSWFRRQKPELKQALVAKAQTVKAEAGRWLYDVGEEARGLYGVLNGSVRILVQMEDGDYALANIVGRGTIFGYAGRLVGRKRLVTAVVRDNATLIYVPEAALEAIAQAEPDLWVHFAELASDHLVAALRATVANARATPAARVAMHLRLLAGDDEAPVELGITQDELAELAGLSRKTVNLLLKALERRGVLETGYRRVRVLDVAGLQA